MIETLKSLNVFAMAHIQQWRAVRFELDVWGSVGKPEESWMMDPSGLWRRHPYFTLLMAICNEPVLLGDFFMPWGKVGKCSEENVRTMTQYPNSRCHFPS